MKPSKRLTALLSSALMALFVLVGTTGCVEKEKTLGEEIEDVGEKIGDEVEDAAEEVEDAAEGDGG